MEVVTTRSRAARLMGWLANHPKTLMAAVATLFVTGSWAWWALQLWGLPDIGDPFDMAAFQSVHVPDERNSFLEYSVASAMIKGVDRKVGKPGDRRKFPEVWENANPAWRELVTEGQEALAVWRQGTDKPDAFYAHPGPVNIRTLLPITSELRNLGRLAILEGSRLEAEGDLPGAWGWYRAAVRSSRHSGKHGFMIERLTGAAIYRESATALTRWAANPKVDAPLLRRALEEVIAADALTNPTSETIKLEYLVFINELDDPNMIEDVLVSKMITEDPDDWCQNLPISDAKKKPIQAARVLLANDRERSLRLARLLTANWLAEADKPLKRKSKRFRIEPTIYEVDPAGPPATTALTPQQLSNWLDTSMIAQRFFREFHKYEFALNNERIIHAKLVVHLATELYKRDHGKAPDSPQAVVGPYLRGLPEGYDAVEEPAKPGW